MTVSSTVPSPHQDATLRFVYKLVKSSSLHLYASTQSPSLYQSEKMAFKPAIAGFLLPSYIGRPCHERNSADHFCPLFASPALRYKVLDLWKLPVKKKETVNRKWQRMLGSGWRVAHFSSSTPNVWWILNEAWWEVGVQLLSDYSHGKNEKRGKNLTVTIWLLILHSLSS